MNLPESMPDRRGQELTGSEIIWEALVREGVTVCFGYPGGAIMPAYDALPNYPIHHVLVRHEQGAAHMADGYARVSGRVGVAVATSGPGATNLVTGIATAMLDSIPIVCITGQVPGGLIGTDAFQEVDITGVTLPITKHNYLVSKTEDIARTIREAFYVARSGRPGPVVVDITKDAQNGRCAFRYPEAQPRMPGYRPEHHPLSTQLDRAIQMIDECERPVILAGHGIIRADASLCLRELVERTEIPVASTLLGLGALPASHSLSLGMMGMHGEAWVNQAIQEADLLIALGMRFDDRVTGRLDTYGRGAKKIHVELDPAEINKNVTVELPIISDVREFLNELVPRVEQRSRKGWIAHIQAMHAEAKGRDIQRQITNRLLAPHAIADVCTFAGEDAVIVTDVGQHQMWEAQYGRHERPRSLLTSGGLGTMGFALPAAIGARFGHPEGPIWMIAGDGGFQMTACELATAVQEKVNINIVIINNGFLGMVRQWQELFYQRRYVATPISSPDFVKLADAHGIPGLRVEQRDGLKAALETARDHQGPFLIEIKVEQEDAVYPMVPAGAALNQMIRRPTDEPVAGEE